MKNYIEDWFKKAIDKLTKEGQEAAVETISITVNEDNKRIDSKQVNEIETIIVSLC
jgi:hypothetical protein